MGCARNLVCHGAVESKTPPADLDLRLAPRRNNVRASQHCTGCDPDARSTFVRDARDVNAESHPALASELSQPDLAISHGNSRSRSSRRRACLRGRGRRRLITLPPKGDFNAGRGARFG